MASVLKKKAKRTGMAARDDQRLPLNQRLAYTVPLVSGAGGDPARPIYPAPRSAGFASVSPNAQVTRTVPKAQYHRAIAEEHALEAAALPVAATQAAVAGASTKKAACDCSRSHIELGATEIDVTALGAAAMIAAIVALLILKVL